MLTLHCCLISICYVKYTALSTRKGIYMNMNHKYAVKVGIAVLLFLCFLVTIPALYQNNRKANQVEREVKEVLKAMKKICASGCTEYPRDWVVPGLETEAELYCMRQCNNDMEGVRNYYLDNFPVLFTSQYNYRVAQLYCVLGLVCPQSQIAEIIRNY